MEQNSKHGRAVFCDFDGTITGEETFVGMLRHFLPDDVAKVGPEMASGRMTLREGVRRLVESIPSRLYPQVLDYIREKPLRPGFIEFLQLLQANGVPFVVISGGLMGSVETRLRDVRSLVHACHAMEVDDSGEYLKVHSASESGNELVAKAKIIDEYGAAESAGIGDGITDFKMAGAVSLVFARDGLARYLESKGKEFIPWNDFFEVGNILAERWGLSR